MWVFTFCNHMHARHAPHVLILIIYAFFSTLLLGLPPINPTLLCFSMFINNLNTVMLLFICHLFGNFFLCVIYLSLNYILIISLEYIFQFFFYSAEYNFQYHDPTPQTMCMGSWGLIYCQCGVK